MTTVEPASTVDSSATLKLTVDSGGALGAATGLSTITVSAVSLQAADHVALFGVDRD